jgi:3-isopropylmalate/(R)-2-methylmalate dehydratase large subunit
MGAPPGAAGRVAAVLAAHAGRPAVAPGERVTVRVDRLLLDGPALAAALAVAAPRRAASKPREGAQAHPPLVQAGRLALVAGAAQPPDETRRLRHMALHYNLPVPLDPGRAGWPGVVATDEGLVDADDVVAGTRPDVGALGALGCVALRAGPLELASLLAGTTLETVVPATRGVRLTGRLPRWVGGFDLAVAVLSACGGPAAVRGEVLELHGDGAAGLTVPERLLACAELAAAGVAGLFAPDARTATWLGARRAAGPPEVSAAAPPPAGADLNLARVRLTALAEGWSGVTWLLEGPGERPPVRIEGAWLGGRIEELRAAAEVLRERNVARGITLGVVPASQRTLLHAVDEGLAGDFLRAGAVLLPPGSVPPPPAAGERRVVALPGSAAPGDILAGPAVAAASAVAGWLTDPESMRRAVQRDSRHV